MLANKDLAKLYMCRRCLNKYAKIKYKNYELKYKYYYYHFRCTKCGEMHHIVKYIKPLYSWKLLFTDNPDERSIEERNIDKAIRHSNRRNRILRWLNL